MTSFRTVALAAIMAVAPFCAAHAAPYSDDGTDRHIRVYNNSDYQVYSIKYGIPGRAYYDRDLLGDDVLNPNYNIRLLIDDGSGRCNYAIRAQSRSGGTFWEKTINVCQESEWKLGN